MPERSPLHPSSVAVVLGLAALLGACDVAIDSSTEIYTAREEKRFAVTGKPDLTLGTFDGSIAIKTWDRPEVVVQIEKRAGDKALAEAIQIKVEQSGDRIWVDVPRPPTTLSKTGLHVGGGSAFFGRIGSSARLTVSVPRDCDVAARTGDGTIGVEGVAGRLDLQTADGSIKGRQLTGTLRARTEDGMLDFRDLRGQADLDTGDGGIAVSGVLSAVRAQTEDGPVTVRAEPGSTVAEPWTIRTADGSVSIDVPETLGASLDARTSDGRVRVDGLSVTGSVETDRDTLRGTLGAGGQTMTIRSGSGTITLRRF
jgi:DUF4097 and DUF4098 domain-containing protein YvlB